MTEKVVGHLTVLERFIDPESKAGSARWLCRCSCGAQLVVRGSQLRLAEQEGRKPSCRKCRSKNGHRAYHRRPRSSKICHLCAGMNHCVEGETCRACGLPYMAEVLPRAHELPQRRY